MVGLNFDFLSLNVVGFTLYSVFNVALYWIPGVQGGNSIDFFWNEKCPKNWNENWNEITF